VIITCRDNDNFSTDEWSIELEGLKEVKQDAWELFSKHFKGAQLDERRDLSKKLPDQTKFSGAWMNGKKQLSKSELQKLYTPSKLGEHHFFDLLGRNPQAIILMALMRKNNPN